ncbi:MAG TPA: VCBS repeat-containing protein [Pirellulaceae bacterium]|nr:VCBS repeat-containing protein [Pirellulaceae bacterium]
MALRERLRRAAAWAAVGTIVCAAWVGLWAGLPSEVRAQEGGKFVLRTFKKVKLSDKFYSEGMYYGDFNKDGKQDVVAGPYYFLGPDFQQKVEYFPAKEFDPHNYSNAFLMFAHDFNADGWQDILVIGWPGKETFWYENPQGKAGHWAQHLAHPKVDNESPGFGDITGDGKPEIICHTDGVLGYIEPNWANPAGPWRFQAISTKGGWGMYTHGLGYGDVNGDGRPDYLLREGWWEHPASAKATDPWQTHTVDFGGGGAQMHVYDVDGDGDNDIITSLQAHGFGLAWFESKKDGAGQLTFERHLIIGSKPEENRYGVKFSQPHAIDLVDMDGDGVKDIVTGKRYWAHGPKGDAEPDAPAVLYWFKTVRGKDRKVDFIPYQIDNDSGVGTQVIAHDVTGDGNPDVLVGNKKGQFVFIQETKQVSEEEWKKAQPTATK